MKDDEINFELYRKMKYKDLAKIAEEMELFIGDRKKILFDIAKKLIDDNKNILFTGYLEIINNSYGMLRDIGESFIQTDYDVHIAIGKVKSYNLRPGDKVTGYLFKSTAADKKYLSMENIYSINDNVCKNNKGYNRQFFDNLTACYPKRQIVLENSDLSPTYNTICRTIDLLVPMGFGSRGLISAPPFSGKTTVVHSIASSIVKNNPSAILIVLLIGERPEEVTEMRKVVPEAIIISSTFDDKPQDHITSCEMTINFAKRLVEANKDVIILMDSITRVVRSNNSVIPSSNRVLSGGVDSNALFFPRNFFGAARNTEEAGSLTIIATNLIENGSKFDELVNEEFRGTGNWDLILDRALANKRIYPAIKADASATRRFEDMIKPDELLKISLIQKAVAQHGVNGLIDNIKKTKTNAELLNSLGMFSNYAKNN